MVTLLNLVGGGGGCTVAAPVPSLSPQLASVGGFDQPYDANDTQTLDSLASVAAAATSQNLIGTGPAAPVQEQAVQRDSPDAIVIPLLYAGSVPHAGRVAGLVDFLRDCAGRAYFSSVLDLTSLAKAPAAFPAVSVQAAAARLGIAEPQLVYTVDPFMPSWRNPETGSSIAATG